MLFRSAKTGRNKKMGDNWIWQECETEKGISLGLYRYVITCKLYRGDQQVGEGVGSCSSMETKYIRAPRDSENTILKIAKKRAFVDAVLTTLGLSDRFTQDVEDIQSNKATTDDSVPVVEAEIVEEPKVDPNINKAKEAGNWLKAIGVTPDQLKTIKLNCGDVAWFDFVLEIKNQGVETVEALMAYSVPKEVKE